MTAKKIFIVVGTRPNFIKVTQFRKVAAKYPGLEISIIHTGQHYDTRMADVFFEQFNLVPDHFLNITPGSPNTQTAQIMLKLEELFAQAGKPDLLLVVGDVNSTLAAALAAHKMDIPLGHIESGLRSFDRTMPEEINRILTDELAGYFFVTEQSGYDNLLKESKKEEHIYFVGNTMIDTLVAFREQIAANPVLQELGIKENEFALMTMHRPATVDNKEGLEKLLQVIEKITETWWLVFPIHPRTLKNLEQFDLLNRFSSNQRIIKVAPMDYFAFQRLITTCKFVITDSGGIQEETTFVGKPCITLRPNTERPSTCELGTNTLAPFEIAALETLFHQIKEGTYKKGTIPPLWDGKATERILSALMQIL